LREKIAAAFNNKPVLSDVNDKIGISHCQIDRLSAFLDVRTGIPPSCEASRRRKILSGVIERVKCYTADDASLATVSHK
jgi:hypothetical protein